MHYLIYLSAAAKPIDNQELEEILTKSKNNNAAKDITGLLLFCENNFLQILEGEKEEVKQLFHDISQDIRHKNIIKVLEGNIDKRNFSDWSMAFKKLPSSELPKMEGLRELNRKEILQDQYDAQTHPAFIFLRSFLDTNLD